MKLGEYKNLTLIGERLCVNQTPVVIGPFQAEIGEE